MTQSIRVSHSTIRTLASCPRKVLFEKELRLFPANGSIAMRYGSGFHVGMEHYYKNNKNVAIAMEAAASYWQTPTIQTYEEDYRNLESLLTSIALYHEQYKTDNEVVAGVPENKLITTLSLTDDEKVAYGDMEVQFVVVLDLLLEVDGMQWVVDFKTTSVDLAYMASRMRKMPQLMGYQFVAKDEFPDINGCMVYYHQLKASKSRKTGLYGEMKTDFMKFPMIFSNKDYADWRRYVIWNAFIYKSAINAGYPPNYNSCYEFNQHCPYLPLCDYPRWDIDKFMEMDGFVVVPDERTANEAK
jgi:hypothetical protein